MTDKELLAKAGFDEVSELGAKIAYRMNGDNVGADYLSVVFHKEKNSWEWKVGFDTACSDGFLPTAQACLDDLSRALKSLAEWRREQAASLEGFASRIKNKETP